MDCLHNKTILLTEFLIDYTKFNNDEASLKNTAKGLEYLYVINNNTISKEYVLCVEKFRDYLKDFKHYVNTTLHYFNLCKHIALLKKPPKKFPYGSNVIYNNEIVTIEDYEPNLDLYEIKYKNGETYGWIKEENLHNMI